MPRNRMPGHGEDNGEAPLTSRLAKLALKRWVAKRTKESEGIEMNAKVWGRLLALVAALILVVANVLQGEASWGDVTGWLGDNAAEVVAIVIGIAGALIHPKPSMPTIKKGE